MQLDLGLTGDKFDAKGSISSSISGNNSDTDDWALMFYASTRFELPLTGLYADTTLHAIDYTDNEVFDMAAALGYAIDFTAVDMIAEIGYRKFSCKLDEADNDIGIDLELDSVFFNLGFDF